MAIDDHGQHHLEHLKMMLQTIDSLQKTNVEIVGGEWQEMYILNLFFSFFLILHFALLWPYDLLIQDCEIQPIGSIHDLPVDPLEVTYQRKCCQDAPLESARRQS